jgi:TolB protein
VWWFLVKDRTANTGALPSRFERLTDSPGEENFPSITADGKQFVYASARSGNWDIYLQRTRGSAFMNLTRDCRDDDTQPALSPDGARIAFRSERNGSGLFVMETTGENPRRVSSMGYLPAWAPDNRHLVYSTDTFTTPGQRMTPRSSLHIVDVDDGSEKTLPTGDAIQPNWSPHGQRIAYWAVLAGGRRDIYTVAASGASPPIAVTADSALDWYPVWAPSGRQLYFLSDRGGTMNIWRIPIDESSGRILGPPEPVTVPAPYVGSLALSGNGQSLIYSQASQRLNLGRIGFDPVRRTVVGTPEPFADQHVAGGFSFSPDGSQIVYDTIGDSSENLWIMKSDGSGRRRLTSGGYRNRAPKWSPKDDEIVFYSDHAGHYDNWLIRVDGSGLHPLTNGTKPEMQDAIWSPDGKRILGGRFGGAVLLNPQALQPLSQPPEAPGLQDPPGVVCTDWTTGGDGSMTICSLLLGATAPEIVVYFPEEGRLERTGVKGRAPFWLRVAEGASTHRWFVFARDAECFLYDRAVRRETRLFSVTPNRFFDLAVAPDGRHLYFSQRIRDSDLWLAHLGR